MTFRTLKVDVAAAAAIEYAIIAALLALGIVGALTTTRSSLSTVLGLAAGQLGSSTEVGSTQGSARFSYWQAKTVSSSASKKSLQTGFATTTISYADGSNVTLRQELDANGAASGRQYLTIDDASTNATTFYYTGYDGETKTFETDLYNNVANKSPGPVKTVYGTFDSKGQVTQMTTVTYGAGGNSTALISTPTSEFGLNLTNAKTDLAYFRSYATP